MIITNGEAAIFEFLLNSIQLKRHILKLSPYGSHVTRVIKYFWYESCVV